MKFLPLIWSGIWRKPGRTLLTLMQVTVVFALFGVLQGLKTGVDDFRAAHPRESGFSTAAIESTKSTLTFPTAVPAHFLNRSDFFHISIPAGVSCSASSQSWRASEALVMRSGGGLFFHAA